MKRYDPVAHGAHCHVCPLKGNVVVPSAPASKRLKLVIVGEGPGRVEEKVGIPFMGSSGKFLDQLLFQQGKDFPRASIHITNAMLCVEGVTMIRMADGSLIRMDRLVKTQNPGPVLAVSPDGRVEAKAITGWYRTPRGASRLQR